MAALAAAHDSAPAYAATDCAQILALYDEALHLTDNTTERDHLTTRRAELDT